MAVTFEEAKAFVRDAVDTASYKSWLPTADRSWNEIKKRQKNNRLWSITPNSLRKRARYPAWYSIFKIRQSLVFSRPGIPIGKDTTQDGNDGLGATAAILLERLATNLPKTFNFFEVLCDVRDDFLVTNFGIARGYYEKEDIKQKVKQRLQPQQRIDELGQKQIYFTDAEGNPIDTAKIKQDDEGYFIELDQLIDVVNEKVCLSHILYKDIRIDPDIRKWERCKRLAFVEHYSKPEFIEIFGMKAYLDLPAQDAEDESKPKNQTIKVYEYHDAYDKEVYWFADEGSGFIQPRSYYLPDPDDADWDDDVEEQFNGLYNLEKFFPVPEPAMMNCPTDEFWPIPEYYQLVEVFEDIHLIFSRMMALTKAIRVRLLFDNNIDSLQPLVNEAGEGDAIGVPNLSQSLVQSGGVLRNAAQYLPIEEPINALNNLYTALEQRLNIVYKLTGTSDLLQGLITDPTQRTFGERQMTEKYALNQLAEPQAKMAKFARDCYQLLCEIALKNFTDRSLDMYIMPQTLQPEHQQRYKAALGLLKDDQKRFRIELETDSTIALNEEYDKKMRLELVNAMTAALEKTANTAQTSPALVVVELHAMKYLIQGYRQGKMFQSEVTQAIDNVIKQAQAASEQQPFNKDEALAQIKNNELQLKTELQVSKQQSEERIKTLELQQNERFKTIDSQLEQFKIQSDNSNKQADRVLDFQKLQGEIFKAGEEIAIKREQLMIEMQALGVESQLDAEGIASKERLAALDADLIRKEQELEGLKVMLSEKEKYMTEQRLQEEHELNKIMQQIEMVTKVRESQQTVNQQPAINISPPAQPKSKRRVKVTKDPKGKTLSTEVEESQG